MTDRQNEQNFDGVRDSSIKAIGSIGSVGGDLNFIEKPPQPPTGATVLLTLPPKPAPHQQPRAKMSEVREGLRSGVIVGISGISGVGKTTIAAALYGEAASIGFERSLWLDFSSAPTVDAIADAMLIELGGKAARDLAGLETQQRCNAALRIGADRRCLVVLDNLETVLTEAGEWRDRALGEFWANWSRVAAASALLVTTQVRPRLWREASVARWESLGGFEAAAAAEFLAAAGVCGSAAELERLSDLVSGHPLTLRLAASYLVLVCGGDLARSEGRELLEFEAIASKPTGDHRGFEASLAWLLERHWQQLSPEQQGFLGRLCVYRVPIDRELAAGMLDGATLDEARLALVALGDRSLLRRLEDGRYRVEPLVARYVAGLGLEAAHDRAIAVFEGRKLPYDQWEMERDVADYVELAHHYTATNNIKAVYQLFFFEESSLYSQLYRQGYWWSISNILHEIIDNLFARSHMSGMVPLLLNIQADCYSKLENFQSAIDFYTIALEISESLNFKQEICNAKSGLAESYAEMGNFKLATESLRETPNIEDAVSKEIDALISVSHAHLELYSYQESLQFAKSALTSSRKSNDKEREARSLNQLANIYFKMRDNKKAIKFYEKALRYYVHIGDKEGEVQVLGGLGNTYGQLGDFKKAIDHILRVWDFMEEIDDLEGIAMTMINIGSNFANSNQYQKAKYSFEYAKILYSSLGQSKKVENCDRLILKLRIPWYLRMTLNTLINSSRHVFLSITLFTILCILFSPIILLYVIFFQFYLLLFPLESSYW
jgi:tetratricopeptide (TPR) repeat protein